MFMVEAIFLQKQMFPDYDIQADGDAIVDLFQYGQSTNIPYFKSIGELAFNQNDDRVS